MKSYLERGKFTEIAEIDNINTIHITQEVRDRCADNYCGFYGKNHRCSPAVGDLEHYRQLIKGYGEGLVFSKAYPVKSRYDYQEMLDAGTCSICKSCAILTDEPCRFPEDAIPSLEAAGIDVVGLSRSLGMTYNNGADKVTYFGLVLYQAS
nr:DUF2284 domain-containing protein [uncultured Acetobacterium sp.]